MNFLMGSPSKVEMRVRICGSPRSPQGGRQQFKVVKKENWEVGKENDQKEGRELAPGPYALGFVYH